MVRYLLPVIALLLININGLAQNLAKFSNIKAGMSNRAIEEQAIRIANQRGSQYGWQEQYYKAVIISHGWEKEIGKNGFLKGRKIHLELLGKLPNGNCVMTDFTFREKYLPDETFSDKLAYRGYSDPVYIDCEQ